MGVGEVFGFCLFGFCFVFLKDGVRARPHLSKDLKGVKT